MKFKKLEIYGFKSFADKLEVKFESGVTAIVGPNGCGKSNVADSIRWVMGEQSAKSMRGSSMQDVIFNGTELRKPQSFAEVSLYFDNSEKIFPLDYSEVVLSRKLFRSGESEYAINKNPCRLKDVVDVLRDSGLGKDSYCVIGQGKIASLLSAKPEERRSVFEEAAGISKFKSKKIEAERKLERTRENLTRINDIIYELERQLSPLAKQSEAAKKFLELKEKLKSLELNIYVYQYDNASGDKQAIRDKLDGINAELDYKQKEFEIAVSNYNRSVESINSLDDQIASLRDELLDLTVGLEKQSGEAKLYEQKIASLSETNDKLSTDISQDETLQVSIQKAIEEKKIDLEKSKHVISELERKIEKLNEEYLEIVDRITAGEETRDLAGDEIYSALEKMGDIKSSVSSLTAEKAALLEKNDEVVKRQDSIKLEKNNLLAKIGEIQEKTEFVQDEIKKLNDKKNEMSDKLSDINHSIAVETRALDDLKVDYHTKLSRGRVLQEMQEDNEGYIVSVKRLLEQSKTNASIGGKIIGVVAKLMKVPQKYETAIEMALGSSVQNIVTKNEDDAKYIVEFLKENRFGRATFLPISTVKEKTVSDSVRSKLKGDGIFGVASELIDYDNRIRPVINHLLGGTVVVDNMDTAIMLAKNSAYSVKIVTLDGDVINPQGSISGGSKKENTINLIGREREIKDLMASLEDLKKQIKTKTDLIEQLTAKQNKFSDEIDQIVSILHEKQVEEVKISDELDNTNDAIDELDRENRQLEYSIEAIRDRIDMVENALETASKEETEISNKKSEASKSKEASENKYDVLRKQREQVYDQMTELKVKLASENGKVDALNSELNKLELDQSTSVYRLRENKLEYQKNATTISELQKSMDDMTSNAIYTENKDKLTEVRNKLSGLDDYKDKLQKEMVEYDAQKLMLSSEIQRASDKKTKEEMNLAKIDSDIEAMQERVWEEYSMTYASASQEKIEGFDLKEGLVESAKIKKQIAALGFVNVNAIEELKDVQARYDDLAGQRDDLTKAEADLVKIIKELTTEMETRFKGQFEQININFQKIFKELFGGGRAELRLEEDEGLLECGIDIVAEPPGKKLQNISLLSGGEMALTAIAILFAILKLRPMPFCVLDEIEAALDDANVERFAKYLQKFSRDTQFIVITHRKPTMELADSLYGVTMEEKGVSKMVSVKLSDAVKNSTEGAK